MPFFLCCCVNYIYLPRRRCKNSFYYKNLKNRTLKNMVYINIRRLRMLQLDGMSLNQLSKHYGVDLFDLNNFIYSHKNRSGTYPVDGKRSRAPLKTYYKYPDIIKLRALIKSGQSIKSIASEAGVPYGALAAHLVKLGVSKPKREAKRTTARAPSVKTTNKSKGNINFDDHIKELKKNPNSIFNILSKQVKGTK